MSERDTSILPDLNALDQETIREQEIILERIQQEKRDSEMARRLQEEVNNEYAAERADATLRPDEIERIIGGERNGQNNLIQLAMRTLQNANPPGLRIRRRRRRPRNPFIGFDMHPRRRRPHSPEYVPAVAPRRRRYGSDHHDDDNAEDRDEGDSDSSTDSSGSSDDEDSDGDTNDEVSEDGDDEDDGEDLDEFNDSDDSDIVSLDDELEELRNEAEEAIQQEERPANLQPLQANDEGVYRNELVLFDNPDEYHVGPSGNAGRRGTADSSNTTAVRTNVTGEFGECTMCLEMPSDPTGCIKCKQLLGCKTCVERWYLAAVNSSGRPACPLCRALWRRKPAVDKMSSIRLRPRRASRRARNPPS